MNWLTHFWHSRMEWDLIIPVILLFLFVFFLLWESRLPLEKKMLRKLWKTKNASK